MTQTTHNKDQYHHGDLCQSLIQAASELIQQHGVDALSMRKLADAVGVSRTAPYHHFKDKNALLCAIAEEGFRLQSKIIDSVAGSEDGETESAASLSTAQFDEFVKRYIQFATEHPAHYDLMYGGMIWKQRKATASLDEAARHSFKRWLKRIEQLQTQGVFDPNESTTRLAQVTWATMHGICRLANDGVYVHQDDILDMGSSAARLFMLNNAPDSQSKHCSDDTHPASFPSSA